ncbi:transcription factor Adf-1-like [Dermacentor silvarum]|uniref:transcription factor Adf-1-like n=1 Tax=Dermacentor silvarum TaxID=543639 RepID=UPI002101548A|nr:transcription factor Adf-1-like [Dermacentor silvarum]
MQHAAFRADDVTQTAPRPCFFPRGARLHRVSVSFFVTMAACSEDGISVPDLVERFLEAVRKFPCIYDTRKLEYRDVLRKENAWEAIRAECGLPTAADCQKLWKRLRDRYTREQKAIELTQRSGSGFVARKTWEFAQAMEFYKQCGRPRKTTCNLELQPSGGNWSDSSESGQSNVEDIVNAMTGKISPPSEFSTYPAAASPNDQVSTQDTTRDSQQLQTTYNTQQNSQGRTQSTRKRKGDALDEQIVSLLDKKMTENEAFGLSVGMTLDRWPKQKAATCKAKIMQVIAELDD